MENEACLFRLNKRQMTMMNESSKIKKLSTSVCSKYVSSTNVSISIKNDKKVNLPQISRTQAKLSYIDSYKNLEKRLEKKRINKSPPTPVSSYLSKVKINCLVPETMGLLKKHSNLKILDISHYSMGNSYADALSAGIQLIELSKAVFKNNRLSDEGASTLVSQLNSRTIVEIDLSQNLIGLNTIACLSKLSELEHSKLISINLDSNNLGDRPVVLLASVLANSDRIRELSLADNAITEYGASGLAKYIKTTQTLEKLDLHWNTIRGEGAKEFADALCDNGSLKVLDLSWNAITSPQGENSIPNLAKAIRQNIKVYHMDLSDNCFSQEECKTIGDALLFNTTLIGLHMDGNGAFIDSKGFLQLSIASSRTRNTHIYNRLMSRKKRSLENCWVCQKWNEVIFTLKPKKKLPTAQLHIELYSYEGENMELLNDRSFRLCRICPPGEVRFFFSSNDEAFISEDFIIKDFPSPLVKEKFKATQYNYVINKECSKIMWHVFHPRAYPRQPSHNAEADAWHFRHSIFKDYAIDNSKLLEQCFAYDCENSGLLGAFVESKDNPIVVLKNGYAAIKEMFKYIAAGSKNTWKLWQENMIDLFSTARIIDNNHLKTNDILMVLRNVRNPENDPPELSRGQFVESLVRIALLRFYKSNQASQSEAIEYSLREIKKLPNSYFSDEFRMNSLWTFIVDKALKKHLNWLLAVFQAFEKNGYIQFKEFVKMVSGYSKNEDIALRSCYLAKETKRYMKFFETNLRFPEFLEAFVRFIDSERIDHDLKRLNIEVLIDIVINDYFKNGKALPR